MYIIYISVKTCWSFHFALFVGEIESLQTKPRWKKLSYILPNVCRSPRKYQVCTEANKSQRFSRKFVCERWTECISLHGKTISSFLSLFSLVLVTKRWSNGLVVKALDSQSMGPVFKTTGWLQGRLSLSSFRGRWNEYQQLLGT